MKDALIALARKVKQTLFGGRTRDTTAADAPEEVTERYGYRCAICGTPVATSDGRCSLCRSTDIVPSDPSDERDGAPAPTVGEDSPADSSTLRTTVSDPTDAEDRLRQMKTIQGDLLEKHAGKWHRRNDEKTTYGVDLPDGGVKYVRTKDDVRSLLWRFYESDA